MAAPRALEDIPCVSEAHELGRRGEALAAQVLEEKGWTILARGFRLGHKEIDIVARRGEVVAFVEVKTRAGTSFGHPLEAITRIKRQEIATVARAWAARYGRPGDLFRFDAVAVIWPDPTAEPQFEHVEDAWRD
jgi:putative endonuclease